MLTIDRRFMKQNMHKYGKYVIMHLYEKFLQNLSHLKKWAGNVYCGLKCKEITFQNIQMHKYVKYSKIL